MENIIQVIGNIDNNLLMLYICS